MPIVTVRTSRCSERSILMVESTSRSVSMFCLCLKKFGMGCGRVMVDLLHLDAVNGFEDVAVLHTELEAQGAGFVLEALHRVQPV